MTRGGDADGDAGRLMITQLVLWNFKSYAGRRVVGPFHKRLSAVVGAKKKLRAKKLDSLIHRSDAFPNLEEASVEVHFCDIKDDPHDADAYSIV
ncbi:MAG: hypothetical protein MHM6MM_003071, partial [Cercozoa sp. M6MM]